LVYAADINIMGASIQTIKHWSFSSHY